MVSGAVIITPSQLPNGLIAHSINTSGDGNGWALHLSFDSEVNESSYLALLAVGSHNSLPPTA